MKYLFQVGASVLINLLTVSLGVYTEETPCSRFDFDHKLLESLVRLEQSHAAMRDELKGLKTGVIETRAYKNIASIGGTYVRWGRTECQQNATTIYKGYAGGSLFSDQGSASNYLCLPDEPEWTERTKNHKSKGTHGARVYGAEYQFEGGNENFFGDNMYQNDVPCAVCEIDRSRVLMIPGKISCHSGWNLEYSGILAAGHYSNAAASEFVCLDGNPEIVPGGKENKNGKLFYPAEARCGSLPCPPYVDGRLMSCVVCSK